MINLKENIYKTSHRFLLDFWLKNLIIEKSKIFKNKKIKIVDFGSGNPRYIHLNKEAKWYFFDKYPKNKQVKFSEIDNIKIKKADIYMCIEVIQYLSVRNMSKLFKESQRIINKNGFGIFTVPYLYPRNHGELIRFAKPEYYKELFSENINYEVYPFGNVISVSHDIFFEFIYKINSKILKKILLLIIYPLKLISLLFEKLNIFKIDSGFIFIIKNN